MKRKAYDGQGTLKEDVDQPTRNADDDQATRNADDDMMTTSIKEALKANEAFDDEE